MQTSEVAGDSIHLLVAVAVGTGLVLVVPGPVRAEIERLDVLAETEIGPFAGKAYREVEARMEGTAPGGAYSVPVTLVLPKLASDHNGFAVVDVVNTITIYFDNWVLGGQPLPLARGHMGDEFLFGRGNAYVGVIWDKAAVEAQGTGTIAAPVDGYTILRDAAALAREPGRFLPEAPASDRLIAYGFSQTGALLREWLYKGRNTEAGAPTFEGVLVGGAGGSCLNLAASWEACEGAVSDAAKVISLLPQTDVERGGFAERGDHSDYRVIEIAGVSHIPAAAADFRGDGMPEQNPVSFGPVFRAALVNLQQWLDGVEPPPSVAIELEDTPSAEFGGSPVRLAAVDADGNAKGGVRLPHMPAEDGTSAGAPLGRYTGFALDRKDENFYFVLSGVFEPFPPEKLAELYPDQDAYVEKVAASAQALAEARYILPEDAEAYVDAAKQASVGN
jgi:Alpha/beta hydrolase domain